MAARPKWQLRMTTFLCVLATGGLIAVAAQRETVEARIVACRDLVFVPEVPVQVDGQTVRSKISDALELSRIMTRGRLLAIFLAIVVVVRLLMINGTRRP